jgi:DNA modification methylase
VVNISREKAGTAVHPTQKPVDLLIYFIENSSKKNEVILDLFGGSGSTLIACEKSKRICRSIELDEKYCDVIVKRYIKFCITNNISVSVKRNGEDCKQEFIEKND